MASFHVILDSKRGIVGDKGEAIQSSFKLWAQLIKRGTLYYSLHLEGFLLCYSLVFGAWLDMVSDIKV